MHTLPSYPRETVEFQTLQVTVDGAPVTTGVQYAVTTFGVRPTTWQVATILDGKPGFLVQGLAPDTYDVWVRVQGNPETPVIYCGQFTIT